VIPVVWSLVYEMRISLMMPLVVYAVVRASARMCVVVALIVSAVSLALVVGQGANPKNANFSGDWAMTAHYLGIFIAGATLAVHRARWRRWLSRDGRAEKVLAASLALYFLSRFVMSVAHGAIGQFIFDWCVAAGAAGLICAALVSKRFASVLAMRPVMFLGALSYSLYLTHTVTLLAVIHLVPLSGSAWPAIIAAALLVVPVAALVHFAVERPSIVLGQFLTGRSVADSQQAKQTS
jgi:peptidoglycan/LPS O-acetylase OafA/YrhL